MRTWFAFTAGVALLAPCSVTAQAGVTAWRPIDQLEFEARLASCPVAVQAFASRDSHANEEHYAEQGSWVRRSSESWGSGVAGATHIAHHIVEVPSCVDLRLHETLENSSPFEVRLSIDGSLAPTPRTGAELALGFPLEVLRRDDPRHGLAGLLADLRRRRGQEQNVELLGCRLDDSSQPALSESLMPQQPWHAGRPRAAPAVWDEGNVTYASGEPRRTRRGTEGELWEVELPSRYGATGLAQYDPTFDRHRWLAVTRECVVGRILWIGARRGWFVAAVGGRSSNYPPELMLVHLARGTVHRLWWPFLGNDDGLPRATALCGSSHRAGRTCLRVSLPGGRLRARIGGESATLDLDALLDRANGEVTTMRRSERRHDE